MSTLAAPQSAGTAATAGTSPAVRIDAVHKRFRLPHQRYSTLKERALHPFASRTYDELHAVNDVSVDIAPGEFFGIVGRNGSGKSTLLKILAGIYVADEGEVAVTGRLSPFIELGVGFNPELTARENVMINGIMLGLTRKQARERFDEIIAFAELEDFVDLKLKNYSSGMSVRLGFAVAIQVDADILLVDEVLAVGDAAFQQKCFEQFQALKDAGRTIVLRHPRHVGGRALLRPRDAAREGRRRSSSATRTTSPAPTTSSTSGASCTPTSRASARRPLGRDRRTPGSRTRASSASRRSPYGEFCHVAVEVKFHGTWRPGVRLGAAQRLAGRPCS